MYKYFPYKRMNHREILLYGFHFSFFLIFTLAVIRDVAFGNYFNASVNASSLGLSIISYYLLHFKAKVALSSNIVMFIAIIPLYTLIYFNHFGNMVIVYVILLPIAAFFLLEFKKALVVNFLMYILLIMMLYYIHSIDPNVAMLNNSKALINIAFASVFITFFGVFYHLAIDSSLRALIISNRQKDILLKEVHHRVKNNLNVTASILGLQARGKSDETQDELAKSKKRIEAIAIIHDMLYKQDNYEEIVFNTYVGKLSSLLSSSVSLKYNDNLSLPLNIMLQLGLIINEILTNSFKHAKNEKGLKVDISLELKDSKYLFSCKDNGQKELNIDKLNDGLGLGFRLINLSVKQLDGELVVSYEKGLKYEITFKNA